MVLVTSTILLLTPLIIKKILREHPYNVILDRLSYIYSAKNILIVYTVVNIKIVDNSVEKWENTLYINKKLLDFEKNRQIM